MSNYELRLLLLALSVQIFAPTSVFGLSNEKVQSSQFTEGKVTSSVMTIGPFDLHRKYRSMEGPYAVFTFKAGDLATTKEVDLPETMVSFVETHHPAPSMNSSSTRSLNVPKIADTSKQPRSLLWLKGVKLEVLDENNHVLPTAEFICHCNIDTSGDFRNQIFSEAERCPTHRLITITQGQTAVTFPDGYGVPVASDEPWTVFFQAANRTTDKHRRVKHRCTFYFIRDSDLMYPITALNWYTPIIYVNIDNKTALESKQEIQNCLSCVGTSPGVNAPNNVPDGTFRDRKGRRCTGHWVVPPGNHTYCAPFTDDREPGFAFKPRTLHAVWSHVHPLCSNLTLYECRDHSRTKIFSVAAKTDTRHGLEIRKIDYWSSKKGVLLPAKSIYELEVTYKNNTGEPQDAMASAGLFFEDTNFVRPSWVFSGKDGYSCMVGANNSDVHKTESKPAVLAYSSAIGSSKNTEPIRMKADPNMASDLLSMILRSVLVIGGLIVVVIITMRLRNK